ncbi:maternal protein tudor-like isoform X3 [Cloeon dipterum]|uniref:maternal protein tudor-like isoform X3 n=1 Tax=Cloeon dipterum TaxID=197152 RepID=UPI00321F897B
MADCDRMLDRILALEPDGPFLKIRGYNVSSMMQIQNIIKMLGEKLELSEENKVEHENLYRGKMLLCKTKGEGSWYRCEVMDHTDYLPGILVRMMEFGTEMSVPLSNLREINSAFHSSTSIKAPAQHKVYYIDGISCNQGWIPDKVERIKNLLTMKHADIKVVVSFTACKREFVVLHLNDVNVADICAKERCGIRISSKEQKKKANEFWGVSGARHASNSNMPSPMLAPSPDLLNITSPKPFVTTTVPEAEHVFSRPYGSFASKHATASSMRHKNSAGPFPSAAQNLYAGMQSSVEPGGPRLHQAQNLMGPPKVGVNTPPVLNMPGMHAVTIIYIENGPHKFFVHLQTEERMFSDICNALNQSALTVPAVITPGLPCAVKADSGVFRAMVTSCDEECTVQFVDLGQTRTVPYSEVFDLPNQFAHIGQLAYKFSLAGLRNPLLSDKEAVNEQFETISKRSSSLRLQVAAADGLPITQYCNLFVGNRNVLDVLIEETSKALQYEHMTLEVGTHHEVVVSHVETKKTNLPWAFYVQLVTEKERMGKVAAQLEEYCLKASIPDARHLKANHPVFAYCDIEEKWNRAMITSVSGSKATVMLMDCGQTKDVPIAKLRAASRQLINALPAQAIKCVLDGNGFEIQAAQLMAQIQLMKQVFIMTVLTTMDLCQALNVKMVESINSQISLNAYLTMQILSTKINNKEEPQRSFQVPDVSVPPPPLFVQPRSINRDPRLDENRGKANSKKLDKADCNQSDKPPKENHLSPTPPVTFSPDNKKRRDWDNPSGNYFADSSNPFTSDPETKKKDLVELVEQYDRLPLKRSSSSGDTWSGKRKVTDYTDLEDSKRESHKMNLEMTNKWKEANQRPLNESFSKIEDKGSRQENKNWREREGGDSKPFGRKDERQGNGFGMSGADRKRTDFHGKDSLGPASQNWKHAGGDRGQRNFVDNKGGSNHSSGQSRMVISKEDEWGVKTSSPPLPHPKPKPYTAKIGGTEICTVVFITDPSNFFVQPLKDAHKIDELTSNTTAEFAKNLEDAPGLSVGDGCWAKYAADGLWYRALVTDLNDLQFSVVFVDYGNSSKAAKSDIQPMKPEHASLPSQGVCCTLRGVDKSKWDAAEIEKFENAISDKEVKVTYVAKIGGKYSVIVSLGDQCINMSFGASTESLLPLRSIPIEIFEPKTVIPNATISWFVSPFNFHIHQNSSCEMLKADIDKPAKDIVRIPLENPGVGTLVHIEITQNMLRGQIVAAKEENKIMKYRVKLVDYGRFKIATCDQLSALPEELSKYPQQAIHCTMANVQLAEGKNWPVPGSNRQFDDIFRLPPSFKVMVENVLENGQLEVSMQRDDGHEVSDLLTQLDFAVPKPKACDKEKAAPKCEWKVFTSYYENNNRFYVQKEADQKSISELLSKLQLLKKEPIEKLESGKLVLARNPEDQMWYRCTITETEPAAGGFLIDYGNSIAVSEAAVLPKELSSIPPFAACCSIPLCAIPNVAENVDKEIQEDLFKVEALTMKIDAVTDDYLLVDFQLDGQTLIEKFYNRMDAIRTFFLGSISNVDSLEAIDCQAVENEADLVNVAQALLKADEFPDLEQFNVGDTCVAKFDDDGLWYRANITNVQDGVTEALFFDYGNSAVVTQLKKIPESVEKIKRLSQLVKMINVPEGEVVENKLYDMLSDSSVNYGFFAPSPRTCPLDVVIFKDGIDLRKIASSGLNIMAKEFKPRGCFAPPADLIKIAVCTSGTASEDVKQIDFEMADHQLKIIPEATEKRVQIVPEKIDLKCTEDAPVAAALEETGKNLCSPEAQVPLEEIQQLLSSIVEESAEILCKSQAASDEIVKKEDGKEINFMSPEQAPYKSDVEPAKEEAICETPKESESVEETQNRLAKEQEDAVVPSESTCTMECSASVPIYCEPEDPNLLTMMEIEEAPGGGCAREEVSEEPELKSAETGHSSEYEMLFVDNKTSSPVVEPNNSDVLSIDAGTEISKSGDEEEDFTLKLPDEFDSDASECEAKNEEISSDQTKDNEDPMEDKATAADAVWQTNTEANLSTEANAHGCLSELAELCCRIGERKEVEDMDEKEEMPGNPLMLGSPAANAVEESFCHESPEFVQDTYGAADESEPGQFVEVKNEGHNVVDDFTFQEPPPVGKLTADIKSHHGSDMSIDEIGIQPFTILSTASLVDAPISSTEVRRVPKRPLTVDQDLSDNNEVEAKKLNMVPSSDAGDQLMHAERAEDSA